MKEYQKNVDDVLSEVGSAHDGLTTAEACSRLKKTEKTNLPKAKKKIRSFAF